MLRIIVGRAGVGKTHHCLEEISQELKQEPNGPPLLLVVPEESTFAMERAILKQSGLSGICRAKVLSFRRLRWRILQKAGGVPEPPLTDLGQKLLLAGLLQTHRDELTIFQDVTDHPGFVDQLHRTIKELQQTDLGLSWLPTESLTSSSYIASALDLMEWDGRDGQAREQVLEAKAHDLALIWREYQKALRQLGLVDDSHSWVQAIKGVARVAPLAETKVWIDGINRLQAPEMGLIAALMQKVKGISITLRLDPASSIDQDGGVFAYSKATFQSLIELAASLSVPCAVDELLHQSKAVSSSVSSQPLVSITSRFVTEELAHIEGQLRYPKGYRIPFTDPPRSLNIVSAANQRDEVIQAARFLIGQARDSGTRWREMAVAASDLELYGGLLTHIFSDCGIPFFLDQPRSVHWHPLMVMLSGVLEVITSDYKTETLMQVLKSDLAPGSRYQVDCLENYALASGIDGRLWREPAILSKIRHELGEEAVPDGLLMPLISLYEKVATAKDTPVPGRQLMSDLWSLLEQWGIPARIDYWVNQEKELGSDGELGSENAAVSTSEHATIWNLWVDLVDDFMQSLGDTPLLWDQFASLLQSGLDNLRLTRIPQGLDQVLISTPKRVLNSEVKVLTILGADEQHLQVTRGEDTILNDAERLALQAKGWHLEPRGQLQMIEEPLFWYSLFTRSKETLYVSYSLADGDGKALEPAAIVKELYELFPGLDAVDASVMDNQAANHHDMTELPCTISDAASFVSKVLRKCKDGSSEIDEAKQNMVLALYDWLVSQKEGKSALARCLAGLNYTNQAGPLSDGVLQRLYGGNLVTNVHHLEAAAQCPFQFFARAVLKLEERRQLRWDPRVEGQLWHDALARLARRLKEDELDLAKLQEAELREIADEVWQEVAYRYAPAYADIVESYKHTIRCLGRGFQRVVLVLSEHAQRGQFRPLAVEVSFGASQGFPAWRIPLLGHDSVYVRGRIDRVETARDGDILYIRVMDFKRGVKKLRLHDVYQGFSLQLLAYLGALMDNSQALLRNQSDSTSTNLQLAPAGALYFPLSEPLVKLDGPLDEESLAAQLLAKYRTSGIVVSDPDVIELMEAELEGRSALLPIGITKKGGLYKGSSAYAIEEVDILLAYAKLCIQALATGILNGKIDIQPYRKARDRACRYCQYLSLCRFELGVPGCGYRYIPDMADAEALKHMAAAVGEWECNQGEGEQHG